jgi:adenylate kinase
MVAVIFIGAPCSGKSTIAKMISDRLKVPYVSSGDIARNLARDHTDVADTLSKGGMAPEVIMRGEVAKALLKAKRENTDVVVLDGFPRFVEQYEWLINSFYDINFVCINVDTRIGTLFDRARLRGRSDDSLYSFMKRINYYLMDTMPIILSANNVYKVAGDDDPKDVIQGIVNKIHEVLIINRRGGT